MNNTQPPAKELERIIRKIKHCLALANSANEHEAAAAMRQARKLMQKYRISDADIQISDVHKTESDHGTARLPGWARVLSGVVAKAFNCQAFTQTRWDRTAGKWRAVAMFIGVTPAPEIAKYAYDTLHFKVSQARKEYIAGIRKGSIRPGRFTPETRGNHYAEAWVSEVNSKLSELIPEPDETLEQTHCHERALAVVERHENELITVFLNQLTNGRPIGKSRARKELDADLEDLLAGALAGRKVELSHGLANAGNQQAHLQSPGVQP